MELPKVLIANDHFTVVNHCRNQLKGKVHMISAATIEEVERQLTNHPDIILIAINGSLGPKHTYDFVKQLRKHFTGHLVAISRTPYIRKQLVALGCTHECNLLDIPQKVLEVLGLS